MNDEKMKVHMSRVSGGDVPDIIQIEFENVDCHVKLTFTMDEFARFLTGEANIPVNVGRLKYYGEDWMKEAYLAARKETERIQKEAEEVKIP